MNPLTKPCFNQIFILMFLYNVLKITNWSQENLVRIQLCDRKLSSKFKDSSLLETLKTLQRVTKIKLNYKRLPP